MTVPKVRRRRGIRTHRAGLTREDIRYHAGLRVTSPARTLLDMAPRLTDKQLKRAFNVLRLDHGLTTEQLQSGLPPGFLSKFWLESANINNGLPYLRQNSPK